MLDTSRPASRILAVLELLQNRPGITGPQLADELDVSARTVRRYITTLQDMGIPVEPTTGRFGGYALLRGFRLPPMMFSADEALGLAVALLTTRPTMESVLPPGVETALTKIERVLPPELASRVEALREAVALPDEEELGTPVFPDPHILAKLAQAYLSSNRIWMRYSRGDGDDSARDVDPWGIGTVFGRWYLLGWCHLREDRRTFRIDRIRRVDVLDDTFEPPEELDIIAAIEESLAMSWQNWQVEIEVEASPEDVRRDLPRQLVIIDELGNGRCRLRSTTSNLEWFAWRIAALTYPMTIISPPELRETFRTCAARLTEIADRFPADTGSSGAG